MLNVTWTSIPFYVIIALVGLTFFYTLYGIYTVQRYKTKSTCLLVMADTVSFVSLEFAQSLYSSLWTSVQRTACTFLLTLDGFVTARSKAA